MLIAPGVRNREHTPQSQQRQLSRFAPPGNLFGDELTLILLSWRIGCICVAKAVLSGLASRFKQLYIKPP
jgi:hypothetical protein